MKGPEEGGSGRSRLLGGEGGCRIQARTDAFKRKWERESERITREKTFNREQLLPFKSNKHLLWIICLLKLTEKYIVAKIPKTLNVEIYLLLEDWF